VTEKKRNQEIGTDIFDLNMELTLRVSSEEHKTLLNAPLKDTEIQTEEAYRNNKPTQTEEAEVP